ncbi:MAG: T9SS type A sorting domain-containing protein [Ignavibacteriaceae bacterium]|nr:T9SS type A sorting domain-containing protein [Ignavibacteriaceae bacterium]
MKKIFCTILLLLGISVFNFPQSVYVGNNYLPLHLGNTYQYFKSYSNNYFTSYIIDTTTITRDTVINNNTYFNYSGLMRYSESDKKIYKFVSPYDRVYMDFNKAIGDTFNQDYVVFNDTNYATVKGGSTTLFSQSYNYKGFYRVQAFVPYDTYTEYYAENFGSYFSGSYYYGMGGGTYAYSNIMMAILYDSLGNMHYYTGHHKPQIIVTPLTVINSNNFNLNFDVGHYYNRNSGIPVEGLVNFIDSVVFESYYKKGDSLLSNPELLVQYLSIGHYTVTTTLDTALMKSGFAFNYRIIAKDKGIIQETSISPDAGYYKCVWDFGQGIENKKEISADYMLSQNYPNPFNPNTLISFSLPSRQFISLKVYDILGNEITTLVNEEKPAGNYKINFNASNLHSGVYFYSIRAGSFTDTKKLILIK